MRTVPPCAGIPLGPILAIAMAALALVGCETTPGGGWEVGLWHPAEKVKRSEAMAIADAYVLHRWRPTEDHSFHGKDDRGIRVDTPDACYCPGGGFAGWWRPNEINTGLPYKWGGFDTPHQFDAALRRGLRAGDVYTPEKRALDNAGVSAACAGVDCSGFVSRCWRLKAPFSTYEISKICLPLPDFKDLRPGDAINKESEHICLFAGFPENDTVNLIVYDVGCPPHWKTVRHLTPIAWLREHGYKPWRYRGMVD